MSHKEIVISSAGPEDFALTEDGWLFISKLLSGPCCTLLRAKASVLERHIHHKLFIHHTVVVCSVCTKGVEMSVAVLLLMKLGKCFLQCELG